MNRFAKETNIKAEMKELVKAPYEIINKNGQSPYENTNNVISNKGWDYIFNTVEKDTHFQSVIATRANGLVAHGFKIMPAFEKVKGIPVVSKRDNEIADFVRYVLDHLGNSFEKDLVAMMTHISRGFSISEKNFMPFTDGKYQGKVGLKDIRFKRQDLFSFNFDDYGRYDIMTVRPDKILVPKNKVIHVVSGFDDENPYGESVAAICAFWVWMKQNGIKYWAIHQERFGSPLTTLKVPDNLKNNPELIAAADEVLKAAETDTGIRIPKNMELTYMEAMRNGDAGYNSFYEITNREMSKAALGSTLTNDVGKSGLGNHALGKVHSETTSIYFNFDMIAMMSVLNYQLIKQIVDINYPGMEKYPRLVWNCFDAGAFVSAAQGIAALANIKNVKIPSSWVNEVLNIPYPEGEEEILSSLAEAGIITPPIKGVDNKTVSSMNISPTLFSLDEKIKENDKLVAYESKQMGDKWVNFAKKIAKDKRCYEDDILKFENNELVDSYEKILILGYLRGKDDARDEILKNKNYSTTEDTESTEKGELNRKLAAYGTRRFSYKPFEEMIKDYLKRNIITKDQYKELTQQAKRKAFTVARVDSESIIKKIHGKLKDAMIGSDNYEDLYDKVMEIFESAGISPISPRHIEVVMRNNLNSQYTDGRFKVFEEMEKSEFPVLQIMAIMDNAVRDTHARLHLYTRPVDDPVWSWLRPPFGHNCRCTIRAVHESEEYSVSEWEPDPAEYEF